MNNNINNLKKILNYYFESNSVTVPKDEFDKIVVALKHLNIYSYKSKEDDCNYHIIRVRNSNTTIEKAINILLPNFDPNKDSKIFFIVNNVKDKLNINQPEYKKNLKIALTSKLGLVNRITTIKDISSEFIKTSKKKYEIEITNRVDSLHYNLSEENINSPCGNVYIASLYDIVNMYNLIGDSLFDLNVRYKISDELNVEKEIIKTLDQTPDYFWFYNNGITIITDKEDIVCDQPNSIEFTRNGNFSVINGAQTITTATKWYSEHENEKNNLKKAWVILRVILVEDISNSFAKEVSVSLNRQKSISEVDIATTYKFVETLNKFMNHCDDDNVCFELNKRGGTPTYKYSYYIDDFAQLVEAYLKQKPGSARSSKGALISAKDNNGVYEFLRKDIFKGIKSSNDIIKYYSPVNFSFELSNSYKKIQKDSSSVNKNGILLKYGNMYCIASVIYCMNNRSTDDFSHFEYVDNKYNADIINKFIDLFETFINDSQDATLDSNDFKKDILYEEFKKSTYMTSLYEYIDNIKNQIKTDLNSI